MKYVKLAENNTATISVGGSWSLIQRVEVDEEIASAYMKGANTFIVDFKDTTFIDSSAIQGLVLLRRKVGKDNFWVINLELSSLVQSTDTRKKEILPYYKYNYAAAVI